jgi:hypothetical protein
VGSNGTVYGWGVTDVTYTGMYHMAYVTTTLTSPVKQRQAYLYRSAQNSVRADVSLPFDPDDLGTYLVESFNSGYCYVIMGLILNSWSQGSLAVPYSATFIAEMSATPLSTAACALLGAPPGSSGYERWVQLELRDSLGSPLAIPNIRVADVFPAP